MTKLNDNKIIETLIELFERYADSPEQVRAILDAKEYLKISPVIFKYEGDYEKASSDLVESVAAFDKKTRQARIALTKSLTAHLNGQL
jgi:hypothetical protein